MAEDGDEGGDVEMETVDVEAVQAEVVLSRLVAAAVEIGADTEEAEIVAASAEAEIVVASAEVEIAVATEVVEIGAAAVVIVVDVEDAHLPRPTRELQIHTAAPPSCLVTSRD